MKHSTPDSTSRSADREYGSGKAMLIPWDLSSDPEDNSDREKKLGHFDGTHANAIAKWDDDHESVALFDGDGDLKQVTPFRLLEPDNWTPRLHNAGGKGKDGTWALRLIVDDTNKDFERKNRSTPVIDQNAKQCWAWIRDQWKVRDLAAVCSHDELWWDDAGFLGILRKSAPAKITRDCLMLNVSKRGGHYTDGLIAAQLWHVLHISQDVAMPVATSSSAASNPNGTVYTPGAPGTGNSAAGSGGGVYTPGPPGPGQTQAEEGQSPGQTKAGGGNGCQVEREIGTLRGDMEWDFRGKLAHFHINDLIGTVGRDPYMGHFVIDAPSPRPPKSELDSENAVSNQTTLQRNLHYGLRPVIKISQLWYPVRPPTDVPTDYPSRPAGTVVPTDGAQGALDGDVFANGVDSGLWFSFEIPETVDGNEQLDIAVNFCTPVAGFGGNTAEFQLDWCVLDLGGDASPAARTGTSGAKNLTNAAYATADANYRMIFHVPASDLSGKEGGKIAFAIYRNGSRDTYTGSVLVTGIFTHCGKQVTQET